jgi:arginine exporter protein ArgO
MIKNPIVGVIRNVDKPETMKNGVKEMKKIAILVMLLSLLNPQAIVTSVDNVITITKDNVVTTYEVNE